VIPRCLEYSTACSLGLLRITRKQENVHRREVKDSCARQEWLDSRTVATAVDFVAEALILKDLESTEAKEAAKFILSKTPSSSLLVRQLANHFMERLPSDWIESSEILQIDASYEYIARLKKSVRMYAMNPIAWSDLSLYYATLGQNDKAKMAMNVALNLGKNNRFILRSASRCFMHMKEPDRAVAILNRSGLCAFNPWIASAEIAISDSTGLKSKCISKARDLIQDDNMTQFSRSELAVSIGTIEIKSGSVRRAKKLMRQALEDPSENALAQAHWMTTQLGTEIGNITDIGRLEDEVPGSYEAQAMRLYNEVDFRKSLKASELWGRFQQLSSRPIIHASHIAATFLEDDTKAISILSGSMPAQQGDFLYNNNYAYSLIRSGQVEAGIKQLENIKIKSLSDSEKYVLLATTGFVCFRTGEPDKGRELYRRSIESFIQIDETYNAALAAYFLAREEKRIGSEFAKLRINEAKNRLEKLKYPPYDVLAKKL